MKCYYHQTVSAVATCRFCGKGVCNDCAVETEYGIACVGKCKSDADAYLEAKNNPEPNTILQNNIEQNRRNMIMYSFLGVICIIYGIVEFFKYKRSSFSYFIISMGIGSLYGGYLNYKNNRYNKTIENNK